MRETIVGWREWAALPDIGIERLRAKLDTGAHTCSLHAIDIEPIESSLGFFIRFRLDEGGPRRLQRLHCWRSVRDAGGHSSLRPVIRTELLLADRSIKIDLCLADRSRMRHRLIIGRRVLRQRFTIDCSVENLHQPNTTSGLLSRSGQTLTKTTSNPSIHRLSPVDYNLGQRAKVGASGIRR